MTSADLRKLGQPKKKGNMKDIYVSSFPSCDLCGKEGIYDSPVRGGRWANLCKDCFDKVGSRAVASRRVIQPSVSKKNEGRIERAFVINSLENICESGVQIVKCPLCDTRKRVEADANYVYKCPCGCEIQVDPQF